MKGEVSEIYIRNYIHLFKIDIECEKIWLLFTKLTNSIKRAGMILYILSLLMDRVPEIGFSGTRNHPKNGVKRQVEHGFSSFFAKFLADLMIFQSGARRMTKNFNVQFAFFYPFLHGTSKTRNPDFGYPIPPN